MGTIGRRLKSIFASKCPSCGKGHLFHTRNPYSFKFTKMHRRCQNCNLDFEPELGFYYGAMYVSYALITAVTITTFFVCRFLGYGVNVMIAVNIIALLLMIPIIFRFSRVIWLNFFVKIPDDHSEKKNEIEQKK